MLPLHPTCLGSAASTEGDSWGGLVGSLLGSMLLRQWPEEGGCKSVLLELCLCPQELPTSAGLQAGRPLPSLGRQDPGRALLGSFPGVLQRPWQQQGSERVGVVVPNLPGGEQQGSCLLKPDYSHHSQRKGTKAANFLPC